jgi:hypothetical protein
MTVQVETPAIPPDKREPIIETSPFSFLKNLIQKSYAPKYIPRKLYLRMVELNPK